MNPLSTVLVLALGALAQALPQGGGDGGPPPFAFFDGNGDGFIDTAELNKLASIVPTSPGAPDNQFMDMVVPMMDADNDGKLNEAEFNQLMSGGPPPGIEEGGDASPGMTLALMDADKSGKVSADEILGFFSKMGDSAPVTSKEAAQAMVAAADTNKDGELDEAELTLMAAGSQPANQAGAAADKGDKSGVESLASTHLSLMSAIIVMVAAKLA